jgi:hypothetical protein
MFQFLGAVVVSDGRDDVQELRRDAEEQHHHEDDEHHRHHPVGEHAKRLDRASYGPHKSARPPHKEFVKTASAT